MHSKINRLTELVHDTRTELRKAQRPKRGLKWHELVPPESVCRDICSMMNGTDYYHGFIARLADYYGVEPMGCFVDTTINPKTIAEYRPTQGNAYIREQIVSKHTVLHEFYHHLEHNRVIEIYKDKEVKADRFATIFLRRAGL